MQMRNNGGTYDTYYCTYGMPYTDGCVYTTPFTYIRLFADGMNNVGLALELASPQFPSMFMLMACMGSIARAITGAAGAATRAAMTHHFAQQYNAADIAAKECSQETATVLVGMLVGLVVAHAAQGVCVCVCVCVSMYVCMCVCVCVLLHTSKATCRCT